MKLLQKDKGTNVLSFLAYDKITEDRCENVIMTSIEFGERNVHYYENVHIHSLWMNLYENSVDIPESLFEKAKDIAKRHGETIYNLSEEVRKAMSQSKKNKYKLDDFNFAHYFRKEDYCIVIKHFPDHYGKEYHYRIVNMITNDVLCLCVRYDETEFVIHEYSVNNVKGTLSFDNDEEVFPINEDVYKKLVGMVDVESFKKETTMVLNMFDFLAY